VPTGRRLPHRDQPYGNKWSTIEAIRSVLDRAAEQDTNGDDSWRSYFGRDAFHTRWPSSSDENIRFDAPFIANIQSAVRHYFQRVLALVGESTAPSPANIRFVTIIAPISTGQRPSQVFLVRADGFCGDNFLAAKIYDPFFFGSDEIVSTHPILVAQALYTREVSVYRHITGRSSQLPVPRFYGSFEAVLPTGRPVYVVLLEHTPGATLREYLPDDDAMHIVGAAIRADQALLHAGIRHRDVARRNFIRRRDGRIAIIDFGDADILENDQQSEDEDMVKRWACNLDFVSAGHIPRARGGGDPESYICACLQMVQDVKGGGGGGRYCMFVGGVEVAVTVALTGGSSRPAGW